MNEKPAQRPSAIIRLRAARIALLNQAIEALKIALAAYEVELAQLEDRPWRIKAQGS